MNNEYFLLKILAIIGYSIGIIGLLVYLISTVIANYILSEVVYVICLIMVLIGFLGSISGLVYIILK